LVISWVSLIIPWTCWLFAVQNKSLQTKR
jgi:hypothetical protein